MEMKDVLISIKGMQLISDGEDQAELITQGKYSYDGEGNSARLSYMESELTGLNGTKTDFLVTPAEVTLSRTGNVNARMVFKRGKKHNFLYDTPYGTITMGLDTHRIVAELDEHGGNLEVEYNLDFESAHISKNTFTINVREQRRN